MAMRDKLSKGIQPHLEPGETLQSVFPAQSGPNPRRGNLLGVIFAKHVVIAVTDRRIAVFKADALTGTKSKELLASYPRETRLNRTRGYWGKIQLGGTRYWVHRRFKKDTAAADAAEGTAAPATT